MVEARDMIPWLCMLLIVIRWWTREVIRWCAMACTGMPPADVIKIWFSSKPASFAKFEQASIRTARSPVCVFKTWIMAWKGICNWIMVWGWGEIGIELWSLWSGRSSRVPYAQGWDIDRVGCDGSITRRWTEGSEANRDIACRSDGDFRLKKG